MTDEAKPTTEPAVPIIAPLTAQEHRSLIDLAQAEFERMGQANVRMTVMAVEDGAVFTATVKAFGVAGGDLEAGAVLQYRGRLEGGAVIQWTRRK